VAYKPGAVPIAMVAAAERTSEMWMEYLGIRLVETRDSSGPAAWTPQTGGLYFVTNESTTWGATNTRNNIVIFDAKAKKPVVQSNLPNEYSVNFGSHGIAVSADGKWIYLPTLGPQNYLLVINGQTLKVAKVYQSLGRPHHVNNFTGPDGRELIMVVDFGWSFSGSGLWVLDPAKDNAVVGGMSRADFSGHPYVASGDVNGQFMYVTVPAPTAGLREKMEGYLAKINMKTWKVEQAIAMVDPIWPEVSPDGKTAWVTLGGESKVAKIDLEKGVLIDELSTGPGPWGARLSYDGTKLYTADKGEAYGYGQQGRTMTVFDTESNIATNVIPIGLTTDHIILSPDGKELWATSNADHSIVVVDAEREVVIATLPMPNDGDTHGSTFIQYNSDGKGGVVGEVVSSFTGLRGSARQQQLALLKGGKPQTVMISPRKPSSFNPATLTVKPGADIKISFVNNSGTSGGVGAAESKELGLSRVELKPGERRTISVKAPTQEGDYKVVNPLDPSGKPLVISVKAAAANAPTGATGSIREIKLVSEHIKIDQKEVKVKAGEKVRFVFVNHDDEKHNLVGIGEGLNLISQDVGAGQTSAYEWTATTKVGTYKVVCAYHPAATFTLEVQQ
jgi:DNA-binding beta-propeller fold protein YncE/plastocyanin